MNPEESTDRVRRHLRAHGVTTASVRLRTEDDPIQLGPGSDVRVLTTVRPTEGEWQPRLQAQLIDALGGLPRAEVRCRAGSDRIVVIWAPRP